LLARVWLTCLAELVSLQMLTGHVLPKLTNMSHIINKVAFGPEFPGQANPLDGFNRITKEGDILSAYKYFLKVGRDAVLG
jgi:hypothetical protein